MNTSSNNAASTGGEDNLSSGGPHKSNKTNVCLICGIYTNLSVNIFEPRSGPDIREVIYQKYNFKAERNDNEDKYICYSCNNWLINWYSLQCLSESQNYEPSSSRSQSEQHNKRSKNERSSGGPSKNKENIEQDNHITSTVPIPGNEMYCPKNKSKKPRHVLKEPVQGNTISRSSKTLVKSFEYNLIKMLESQGTSVTEENRPAWNTSTRHNQFKKSSNFINKINTTNREQMPQQSKSKEIILSFNSAISEVVNHIPSLENIYNNDFKRVSPLNEHNLQFCLERLSESLSVSLLNLDSVTDNL